MTSGSDSIPYLHDYLMNDEDNSGGKFLETSDQSQFSLITFLKSRR